MGFLLTQEQLKEEIYFYHLKEKKLDGNKFVNIALKKELGVLFHPKLLKK